MIKCPCTPARRGQFLPPEPSEKSVGSDVGMGMGTTFGGE